MCFVRDSQSKRIRVMLVVHRQTAGVKNENVDDGKYDDDGNQVRGFPTLKLFKADTTVVDYSGGR